MTNLFNFPWENDEKPFFTNEEGFEWYPETDLTNYCKKELSYQDSTTLDGIVGVYIKKGDYITRALYDTKKETVIYDSQSFEAIYTHVDQLKLIRSFNK